jgi:putative membrane protein
MHQQELSMEKIKNCLMIALALGGAAVGCSSDEPSSEAEYPQPAASVGDEATPEEATPENTTPQPGAATEPSTTTDEARAMQPLAPQTSPSVSAAPEGTAEPMAESLRDAQIIKVADLVNASEVEQAKLAKTKAKNPQVQKFAAAMISQHTKAKQKGMQLSKAQSIMPEESRVAGELESKGAQTLQKLQDADKSVFDVEYMTAQVQQHQEVLDMLTTQLIPSATDPKLKAELEATRTMVQRHLTDAQQIQRSLGTGAGTASD